MKRLSTSTTLARERKERYSELRRSGLAALDAAIEIGIDGWTVRQRYERWFQVTEGLPSAPPRLAQPGQWNHRQPGRPEGS